MNVIVDIQGFKNERNEFIPKEIAIISKSDIMILLIKPPYPFYDLTKKERVQVAWIERNRGIKWNEGIVPYYNYKCKLQDFLKNKCIFTKGAEKVLWLKDIFQNNYVYNLEDKGCPNFATMYRDSSNIRSCIYHKNICAVKNVFCLYNWCKENNVIL